MTTMTVEGGNKIIAEFMGMKPAYSGKELTGWFGSDGRMQILGEYRPHQDWNELMPVWNKLWYHTQRPDAGTKQETEWNEILGNRCARAILYGTVLEAQKEIVEAIQWFNQSKNM